MIRFNWQLLPLLILILFATACSEDDLTDPPPSCIETFYDPGVFITNEGPFSEGSGSITYFNPGTATTRDQAFTYNNCDEVLGSIVQSMYIFEDRAFVVVNNSNKIVVADANTLEKIQEIEGFALPRYFLPIGDDKALISQWGADGLSGSVAVLDLNSFNILKTIPCGTGPENMIRIDQLVYVANAGGYGRDSTVAVIDIETETLVNTITTGHNPQSFVVDNTNQLWVLCKGYTDFYDPANNRDGQLAVIKDQQVTESRTIPNGSSWLAINNAGDQLYHLAPQGIYLRETGNNPSDLEPLIEGSFYAMAIDFNTDQIYASDALDFASSGKIYRYDLNGTPIDSFAAGIIPGGFWFE